MASEPAGVCLYPTRDPDTACGYAHTVRTYADEEARDGE